MTRKRMLALGVGVVLLFCLVGGLAIERHVTEANRNLFAAQVAANALLIYVTDFKKWPETIEDLKKVETSGAYDWPKDGDEVTRRIHIRYGISLNDVAMTTKDNFPYLVPLGPIFVGSFQAKIESIIIRSKEIVESKRQ